MQPLKILQTRFVAIIEQIKKGIKKNKQKLIPAVIISSFPTKSKITYEGLGAAFRKFAVAFSSYSKTTY